MQKFALLLLFLIATQFAFSQSQDSLNIKLPVHEKYKFAVGIEASYMYHSFHKNKQVKFSYGINFEYPIRQFSIGIGFIQQNLGNYIFKEFTGDTRTDIQIGEEVISYYHFTKKFPLKYFSLSNRIQYNLPGDYLFAHAAVNISFLDGIKPTLLNDDLNYTLEEPYIFEEVAKLKRVNTSLDLGLGFKLHLSKYTRLIMIQSFNIIDMPTKQRNQFFFRDLKHLQVSLGLQVRFK